MGCDSYKCVLSSGVRTGGRRVRGQPPIDDLKIIKSSFFETIRLFSCRVCRNCCHVFLCNPTCLLISRNYHGDAIILVVKLFWWVALEPTTNKMQTRTKSMGIVNAGVVLWRHEAIVFNGSQGWTTQRSSAGGIPGREWLQRRRMFRLRCHNLELTKPASWG